MSTAALAQNITTLPQWNGSSSVNAWGSGGFTPTYGQTFTPGAGQTNLTGITFELNDQNGKPQKFLAEVYQWTGTGITGPALFKSSPTSAPTANVFTPVAVQTGGVTLKAGTQYVVFFTTLGSPTTNARYIWGGLTPGTYAKGSYVYTNLSSLTQNWDGAIPYCRNCDLAFALALSAGASAAAVSAPVFNPQNVNQQNVANALTNVFKTNGSIPMAYGTLTPAGLTQASGELATGSQQTTFDAMNLFMGLLTDPFMNRNGGGNTTPGSTGYADEPLGYAASNRTDAFAMFTKAPPVPFEQHWSVWSAGYGGSQNTDGNAVIGSNNTTSSVYGTAVGADYRISPYTIAGFALAAGGTNFSVAGSGSGHSDLFQAGAFIRHDVGAAYLSGAVAYGWQEITTNRTVTVAGSDQLRAQFDANAFSGRLEGGYRFVAPWVGGVGITPYAAAQFTTFDLPGYAEQATVGFNVFALAYGAKDVTDTRSELGIRTDKSFALSDGVLILRSRFAWAHDYDPDRSIAATFQTLPSASFVVNGAAQASDSALVTASVEKKWLTGWSAAATFEGEFSDVTRSYAGKVVVRYQW